MKRLGVFAFNCTNGHADGYVNYLLSDISKKLDKVIIVTSQVIDIPTNKMFQKYTTEIVLLKNNEHDFLCWKNILTKYLKKKDLLKFDELVLFNDSFFGPLYSFEEIFKNGENLKTDFWGISKHPNSLLTQTSSMYGRIYEYIETSFICFKHSIFKTELFNNYWNKFVQNDNLLNENTFVHSTELTKFFGDNGFTYDVLFDFSKKFEHKEHSLIFENYMPYDAVKFFSYPIINKTIFYNGFNDKLAYTLGYQEEKLLNYIKEKTNYPVELIWEHLLNGYDLHDIKQNLNLVRVFPKNYKLNNCDICKTKIAFVMHLYYLDLLNEKLDYLKAVPKYVDLYLTINDENKKNQLQKYLVEHDIKYKEIIVVKNRGRDVSALLIGGKKIFLNYDIVGFVHDKKPSSFTNYPISGKTFEYLLFENLLSTTQYIENIISAMIKYEKLGLFAPPTPCHNGYYGSIGDEWTCNYIKTEKLIKDILKLKVPMSAKKHPFCLGTAFWCKTKALKPLFEHEWKYDDFPSEPVPADGTISHAIERCFQYVAQSQGYYSSIVMTDEFCASELNAKTEILANLETLLTSKMGKAYTFNERVDLIEKNKRTINKNCRFYKFLRSVKHEFLKIFHKKGGKANG